MTILRPREDFYAESHPLPEDAMLLIGVSDTSRSYSSDVKVPLYARAGIPEVRIVDLEGRRVLVHRGPAGDAYREITIVEQGTLTPAAFPDLVLRLEEIIG